MGENLFEKGIVIVNWCCTSKKSAHTVFCLLLQCLVVGELWVVILFFFFLGDKWGMPKTIVDPLINTKIIYLPKKKKTTRLPHLNIDSIHSFLLTVT